MIEKSILLLRDELEDYIKVTKGDNSVNIIVDNIGLLGTSSGDTLANSIIITLVNIEEESTLKFQKPVKKTALNKAVYQNPPVHLNLYILLTCNYSGNDYRSALRRLSYIIQFLQSKTNFTGSNTIAGGSTGIDEETAMGIKFTIELCGLTFEQINHLWGSLGGRQVPFAVYKLRLGAFTEKADVREVPLIEEIDLIHNKIPGSD